MDKYEVRHMCGAMSLRCLGSRCPHKRDVGVLVKRWVSQVSIDRFAEFVNATGYITEAERFGWSFVHEKAIAEAVLQTITQAVQSVPWWLPV